MKKLFLLFLVLTGMITCQLYQGQAYLVNTCSTNVDNITYSVMRSNTTANDKQRMAFIIPASQLDNIANGTITSTYFKRSTASGSLNAGTNFRIYLKNTTATDFGSTSPDWATETGSATLVYDSNPQTAVGSTAGYKQFQHSANFVYTAGSNLAVFTEYVQTTAQASTIYWQYEYSSPCINTSNSNTTKYVSTTSTFGATLTSTNYRRPVIAFDANVPPPTTVPNCTTISAPANAATGISVTPTITWSATPITSSYVINMGTTPGGTDIMNGVDVGNVTSYTIPAATPLAYSTQYYVTVIPKNVVGMATSCNGSTFTTLAMPCPSVNSPTSAATGVSTIPTISWGAISGATGYKLTVGTTSGGTDVLNNVDLGNVTSYTFASALASSTTYYYTVTSYNASTNSGTCTVRSFTTTATAPPANDNCGGAIALTVNPDLACGATTAGNTLGASLSMAATPCNGNPDDDVWYSFVATSASHVVALSNVVSTGTSSTTDMYFQVLSGACGSQTSVVCSDPNTATVSGLTPGQTYYIRVYTYSGAGYNASFNICVGTPPPPPANDNCANPTPLTVGGVFATHAITTTNVGATADGTAQSCQTSATNNVWYSVVVPASGTLKIETNSVTGSTYTDSVINVFSGACGSLTPVACDDDSSADGNFSLVSLTGQTPGATLLVSVWRYSSGTGTDGQFKISAYDASLLATSEVSQAKNDLKAYPNPFADVLNISDISKVKSVSIVDVAGRVVKTIENPSSALQLGDLKQGLYLVTLNMKDGSKQTIKAIKK
ncbi:T9SS type A sorting domain-containing protein [Chryseobacterium sp. BLS98]|uniref:T9SS type A sorting domain-containing protein n=1 Tax=Chryseobacterium sp. BLS98 TaxID=885586 RepID=UPI0009FC076B|nr:T9SS type A sorting domain-containing protein [Chryseobacterium sp. BLS98]